MITKPLVLVLGAGASAPYGFPTGWELTQNIIRGLGRADDHLYKILSEECRFDDPQISHFRDDLDKSQHHSVDAFLEHRGDHLVVGKATIAASLIPFEDINKFSRLPESPKGDRRWYSYLLQHLDTGSDKFANNDIAIITFNYDRSLEYFLFQSLMSRHNIDYRTAAEMVESIPIVHVYGSLGAPDFASGLGHMRPYETRPYKMSVARTAVLTAAEQIHIISEERSVAPAFKQALERLAHAETICFIGFGYDPVNMERLGLKSLAKKFRFIGTGYDLNEDDYRFARTYLSDMGHEQAEIHLNRDALWVVQNAGMFR